MTVRYRAMRPKDVRGCVEIVAKHPVMGPRYGAAIADLRSAWLKMLGREAFRAVVFEDVQDSSIRLFGCGVSVFVSDEFIAELKTPPFFWVTPELVKRTINGNSPLLSDKQVQAVNSDGGLNLLVWEGTMLVDDFSRPEVLHEMFVAFAEQHLGFLLKELISHSVNAETLNGMIDSGGLFLSPDGSYADHISQPLSQVLAGPHYFGLTRALAQQRWGTWMASLFAYQPPQFGFRVSEQRLLLSALRGGNVEDLADELGISISAVKKTWRSIYDRVASCTTDITPASEQVGAAERGKEKKQRLIAYLRDHPEELRPAAL